MGRRHNNQRLTRVDHTVTGHRFAIKMPHHHGLNRTKLDYFHVLNTSVSLCTRSFHSLISKTNSGHLQTRHKLQFTNDTRSVQIQGAVLVAFFNFLISLVAQVDRVLVLLVLLLLPTVSSCEMGSTSRRVTMSRPKAAQRSPISPALAATLASLCSLSLA